MDTCRACVRIHRMTAIRVIFDGKAFVPQEPVSLPEKSEAIVIVEADFPAAHAGLDAAVRAYYENKADPEDDDWAAATSPGSRRAWDED
jgi:hypothetical protein